eukprot:Opistho-1_new@15863
MRLHDRGRRPHHLCLGRHRHHGRHGLDGRPAQTRHRHPLRGGALHHGHVPRRLCRQTLLRFHDGHPLPLPHLRRAGAKRRHDARRASRREGDRTPGPYPDHPLTKRSAGKARASLSPRLRSAKRRGLHPLLAVPANSPRGYLDQGETGQGPRSFFSAQISCGGAAVRCGGRTGPLFARAREREIEGLRRHAAPLGQRRDMASSKRARRVCKASVSRGSGSITCATSGRSDNRASGPPATTAASFAAPIGPAKSDRARIATGSPKAEAIRRSHRSLRVPPPTSVKRSATTPTDRCAATQSAICSATPSSVA